MHNFENYTAQNGQRKYLKVSSKSTYFLRERGDLISACSRFASHYKAMRKNEELLRRLKKGKKSAFSLFSSASSAASSDDLIDEDRVRTQVLLDVDALGKDAAAIGVSLEDSHAYKTLRSLAQSKYEDVS